MGERAIMDNSAAVTNAKTARAQSARGLVLEFENIVFAGRQLKYVALERVLQDRNLTLTPIVFSNFALHALSSKAWDELLAALGKKKLSIEKLDQDFKAQYRQALEKNTLRPNPWLEPLLAAAARASVSLGALSNLPAELVPELVERLGLQGKLEVQAQAENGHPTPDGWLKLAKAMALPAQACLALTTEALSCRSALVAGMRCVVLPDAYTSHQDFGGADLVLEDPAQLQIKDLMALMHPSSYR